MRYLARELERQITAAAKSFPAVVLTGPRRSGKTFLLRHLLPKASYYLFEDPDVVARFRYDPQGFLDEVKTPAILDEIQNVPEVFNFVRARSDRRPRRTGQVLPMSARETPKVNLLHGGYPEVLARPRAARLWFSSYLLTYLERDVRAISAVHDLAVFRRFLAVVASRHGQVLNKSDLAAPLGMSVPGIGRWLDILEATGQILLVLPYFENVGKRLIKSPKIYIADSGLACHLLGIDTPVQLEQSPFLGPIFEGFIAGEMAKAQLNAGRRRELYYFRDQQGLEVDFIVPTRGGGVRLVEAKAARTVKPSDAVPLQRLAAAWRGQPGPRGSADMTLVHRPSSAQPLSSAVAPGVRAMPWPEFVHGL